MLPVTLDLLKAPFGSGTRKTLSLTGYKRAAVLIPLIETGNSYELLFTTRTHTVETHKGQISFPGGMVDVADTDIVFTALREAREEIGLPPDSVEVLGELDDMATPTGFVITPVVGVIATLPELQLNISEVADTFRLGLCFFANPAHGRSEIRTVRGREYEVWYYNWEGRVIWGATAMIIRSLLRKIGLLT